MKQKRVVAIRRSGGRRLWLVAGLGILASFGVLSISDASAGSGNPTPTPSDTTAPATTLTDCSQVLIPSDVSLETGLDYTNGLISIYYWDPSLGTNRAVTVRYTDSACRPTPSLQAVFTDSLLNWAENQRQICADLEGRIASNTQVDDQGQPINLDDAALFVSQECSPAFIASQLAYATPTASAG